MIQHVSDFRMCAESPIKHLISFEIYQVSSLTYFKVTRCHIAKKCPTASQEIDANYDTRHNNMAYF